MNPVFTSFLEGQIKRANKKARRQRDERYGKILSSKVMKGHRGKVAEEKAKKHNKGKEDDSKKASLIAVARSYRKATNYHKGTWESVVMRGDDLTEAMKRISIRSLAKKFRKGD